MLKTTTGAGRRRWCGIVVGVEVEVTGSDGLPPAVRELVVSAFGDGFDDDDWDHALGGCHALVRDGGRLVAHAAAVPRTLVAGAVTLRAAYVEAVATDPAARRVGFGSAAMTAIAAVIERDHDLGALSTGAHAFYGRLGWERWRGPTFVRRRDGTVVRTEDEDDGIMVLRTARTRDLDLRASLTCEERSGDDW